MQQNNNSFDSFTADAVRLTNPKKAFQALLRENKIEYVTSPLITFIGTVSIFYNDQFEYITIRDVRCSDFTYSFPYCTKVTLLSKLVRFNGMVNILLKAKRLSQSQVRAAATIKNTQHPQLIRFNTSIN